MTADEVRTHVAYSGWASRRLLDAILDLKNEQRYRDLGVPNRDVVGTLGHVVMADAIVVFTDPCRSGHRGAIVERPDAA